LSHVLRRETRRRQCHCTAVVVVTLPRCRCHSAPLSLSLCPLSLSHCPVVVVTLPRCRCHSAPLSLSLCPVVVVTLPRCRCHSVPLSLSLCPVVVVNSATLSLSLCPVVLPDCANCMARLHVLKTPCLLTRTVGNQLDQERTGSSNRPWLSRQTGHISSGVIIQEPLHNYLITAPSKDRRAPSPFQSSFPLLLFVTLSLAPFSPLFLYPSPVNGVSHLTYFNI